MRILLGDCFGASNRYDCCVQVVAKVNKKMLSALNKMQSDNATPTNASEEQLKFEHSLAQYAPLHRALNDLGNFEIGVRPLFKPPSEQSPDSPSHVQQLKDLRNKLEGWTPISQPVDFIAGFQQKLGEAIEFCKTLIDMLCEYLEVNHSFPSLNAKMESGAMQMLEQRHVEVKGRLGEFSIILKQMRKLSILVEGDLHYLKARTTSLADDMAREYAKCQVENKQLKLEVEDYKVFLSCFNAFFPSVISLLLLSVNLICFFLRWIL